MDALPTTKSLTRADLAQMVVILHQSGIPFQKPKQNTNCHFSDTSHLNSGTAFALQSVCERGVMGIETATKEPLQAFLPEEKLSYEEFGTVLGRMLFGYTYEEE